MKSKLLFGLALFFSLTLFMIPESDAQNPAENNKQGCDKKYGEDSATCIMNISLYREFYKQWKKNGYKTETVYDAFGPWRWVLLNCPCGTQNTYIDGVKIIGYMIDHASSPEIKDKYIDTLMMVYDNRIKYFNKEGYILGRKGVDLYRMRTKDFEQAYQTFKRSVELEGLKSPSAVVVYYFRTTIKMATSGKIDSSVIVETYDQLSTLVDENIKKHTDKGSVKQVTEWENAKGNIELTFEPFATCEDLVKIYSKKFNENPDDIDLLKKITSMLDKKKCNDTELFFNASIKLYDQEPSPEAALLIGKMYVNSKNYEEAIRFFDEATGIEDPEELADAYYYMAFCYQILGNKIQARLNAYKAIENNPNYGNAYILIGDLYAASSDECAANDLSKRAVYWVAVDMYARAKSVDPSVAESANNRINSYSKYFPSVETAFFYNLSNGDTYMVECWINKETRVRTSD